MLAEETIPPCPVDGFLVRNRYTGISNGTERNYLLDGNYRGAMRFPKPHLGYSAVGEIIEVGADAGDWRPGEIVLAGTFHTHREVHAVRRDELVCRLPAEADLEAMALLGVAAVGWHQVRRAGIVHGDRVLLCGVGPIGIFALQAAKARGAAVDVVCRNAAKADTARRFGARDTFTGSTDDLPRFLAASGPWRHVIETTGSDDVLAALIGRPDQPGAFALRSWGQLVLTAGRWTVSYESNWVQRLELSLVHAQHYDLIDLQRTVAAALTGQLRPRDYLHHQLSAEDAPAFYAELVRSTGPFFGAVIRWT